MVGGKSIPSVRAMPVIILLLVSILSLVNGHIIRPAGPIVHVPIWIWRSFKLRRRQSQLRWPTNWVIYKVSQHVHRTADDMFYLYFNESIKVPKFRCQIALNYISFITQKLISLCLVHWMNCCTGPAFWRSQSDNQGRCGECGDEFKLDSMEREWLGKLT